MTASHNSDLLFQQYRNPCISLKLLYSYSFKSTTRRAFQSKIIKSLKMMILFCQLERKN